MKALQKVRHSYCFVMRRMAAYALCLSLFFGLGPARACTIFVLTDAGHTLFCNNEDGPNDPTRIWFIPAGPRHFGAVYVGYNNGWAQGGLNSQGLAFDWVAGWKENWGPEPGLPTVFGNQQVLETCATIEEAITFFRTHHETGFSYAKILLADRTGASVIVGAKEGKLQVEKSNQTRGFGYGGATLQARLAKAPQPTVANGSEILRACLQKGQYATRYFNIFDLESGDIFLYPFTNRNDSIKLDLAKELEKGGHYYDMAEIRQQLAQAPRPLLANMERCALDKYKPIPDKEPQVTTQVRKLLQDVLDGSLHPDDYTDELWKGVSAQLKETRELLKTFGSLTSLALVDRSEQAGNRVYRYRFEFEKQTILQQVVFNQENKLVASQTEDIR